MFLPLKKEEREKENEKQITVKFPSDFGNPSLTEKEEEILRRRKNEKPIFGLRREETALAICPITGIVIRIGIPSLSFALEYRNPLAEQANILKIAFLSDRELRAFPLDVLAGGILALLESINLLQRGTMPAEERNRTIRETYEIHVVINMLKALAVVITKGNIKRREELPLVNLEYAGDLQAYITTIHEITFPPTTKARNTQLDLSVEGSIEKPINKEVVAVRGNISISARSKIKIISKKLLDRNLISQKANAIFQNLGLGHNWKTLTGDEKRKYLAYLLEKMAEQGQEDDNEEQENEAIKLLGELELLIKEIPVKTDGILMLEEDENENEKKTEKKTLREMLSELQK